MKNAIYSVLLIMVLTAAVTAENGTDLQAQVSPGQDSAAPVKKKVFMQVGAVEKVENDKYIMRKTETRYEFYLAENVKLFLRAESSFDALQEKNYLVIKGPKNKKVVLANAVYIYTDKAEFDGFADKKEENPEALQKVFSTVLEGTVKQKYPLILSLADGTEYVVSFDADTYWIMTKKTDKSEIIAGERIKLFFDKLYSIRYKNYPVKIVVDRVKAGF